MERLFGLKPLVVELLPPGWEKDIRWWSYLSEVEPIDGHETFSRLGQVLQLGEFKADFLVKLHLVRRAPALPG